MSRRRSLAKARKWNGRQNAEMRRQTAAYDRATVKVPNRKGGKERPTHKNGVALGTACEHPCPDCGWRMILRDSKYGLFYGCETFPRCRATHGAHPDGRPLGIPANKETKAARIKAHEAFDWLWKANGISRPSAYHWLQTTLGMTPDEAHIGRFGIAECDRLIQAVQEIRGVPDPNEECPFDIDEEFKSIVS